MYDVIVIGGGPGGYKTAELCGKSGMKVALVEENEIGGTCLNQGCIPLKSYLHTCKTYTEMQDLSKKGLLLFNDHSIAQKKVYENKNTIVNGLKQSVTGLLKQCGVEILSGCGELVSKDESIFRVSVNGNVIEGKQLVIATGSVERRITDRKDVPYKILYSKDMLDLDYIPDEIDIIGAGSIGLEAACFFSEAGSKVTVIESQERIGGHIDAEIALAMESILSRRGINFLLGTSVKSFEDEGVVYECNGNRIIRQTPMVLVSIGRIPRIDRASLDRYGIAYSDKGIVIDDKCRTNVKNVYACGDVTGNLMLAHVAYRQAKVISESIKGKGNSVDYSAVPRVIYSYPEILSVGMTEQDCKDEEYYAKSLPMTYSGRYFAENGKDGAKAKIIIDKERRIIGFHMIGNSSSEISIAAELMIAQKLKIEDIQNLIFAHPTYGEIIGELAELFI